MLALAIQGICPSLGKRVEKYGHTSRMARPNTHKEQDATNTRSWIQLLSATTDELLKNTSFGVLNPRHFLGRLFNRFMTNSISC